MDLEIGALDLVEQGADLIGCGSVVREPDRGLRSGLGLRLSLAWTIGQGGNGGAHVLGGDVLPQTE